MSSKRGKSRSKSRTGKQEEGKETLAYKILSAEQTKSLTELEDVDQMQENLAEILKITDHATNLRDGATLDYYVSGLWWGKEQGYSVEQLSAFFTVLHIMLDHVKEKQITLGDNLIEFKKLLVGIGQPVQENPEPGCSGGLECFDTDNAKAISQYLHHSLYQHYKMYEFMFSHNQAEEIIGTDLIIEIPKPADMPWPAPLDDGVSEQIYRTHIVKSRSAPATPASQPEDSSLELREGGEGEPTSTSDEKKEGEGETATKEGSSEDVTSSERESELLAELSPEEITSIMNSVFEEMLGGLKKDVAAKLRDKENALINRINKVHRVAED